MPKPTKEPRFSKAKLAKFIVNALADLEENHKFDPRNGYDQVIGQGEGANRAYGEYAALMGIADQFELDLSK